MNVQVFPSNQEAIELIYWRQICSSLCQEISPRAYWMCYWKQVWDFKATVPKMKKYILTLTNLFFVVQEKNLIKWLADFTKTTSTLINLYILLIWDLDVEMSILWQKACYKLSIHNVIDVMTNRCKENAIFPLTFDLLFLRGKSEPLRFIQQYTVKS